MVESSFQRLTCHFNNNHLVLCEFRLSVCKRKEQNWHEFDWSCLAQVKSPSQVGSKQHQIGIKCVVLVLLHNTIGIALVDSDGGHVLLATKG
jgi:hypothetical protein